MLSRFFLFLHQKTS